MKEEVIKWSSLIQIPDPETTLTIFLHMIVHYWRAENNKDYYRAHFFPQDVENVLLRIDHNMYQKARYHLYEVNQEDYIGVWDETPYHLDFRPFHERNTNVVYLDHGDYRHDFQLFLRSFLKEIKKYTKYYPSLDRLSKILTHFPLLQWKCPICRLYNDWSREFIESFLLEKNVSIAPSSLLYLLTFSNKKMGELSNALHEQQTSLNELLVSALSRFFVHFEKIYEQTSVEPIVILDQLITILEKYVSVYTIDQIHEFEHQCAREMKNYLYDQFKFLRTKNIQIHHFPRDMMIIRDVFALLVGIWSSSSPPLPDGSPGILMLLTNILFQDKALSHDLVVAQPLVVFHALEGSTLPLTRHMTPHELQVFTDYHPLLRQTIFKI